MTRAHFAKRRRGIRRERVTTFFVLMGVGPACSKGYPDAPQAFRQSPRPQSYSPGARSCTSPSRQSCCGSSQASSQSCSRRVPVRFRFRGWDAEKLVQFESVSVLMVSNHRCSQTLNREDHVPMAKNKPRKKRKWRRAAGCYYTHLYPPALYVQQLRSKSPRSTFDTDADRSHKERVLRQHIGVENV